MPELQKVAVRVLAQVCSSCSCERINSECDYVKPKKSNRMTVENMERLVKIHHNLRIMHRIEDYDYEEVNIIWDVDALDALSDDEQDEHDVET